MQAIVDRDCNADTIDRGGIAPLSGPARAIVLDLVRVRGVSEAARTLKVSRGAMANMARGRPVLAGTRALALQWIRRTHGTP